MKTVAVVSLGALVLAAPTQDQRQGTKITFDRRRHQHVTRADGSIDLDWLMGTVKYTMLKYNSGFELPEMVAKASMHNKRDTDAEEKLTDFTSGQGDAL